MAVTGTLIEGKYEILAKIREGGMGTIYKVRHRLLDEIRVVKVMRPHIGADEELRRRFTQEAKTATRLKHPNIGAILDFALDADGMAYIVMEFIDGVNLSELLATSGPPPVPLTLEVAHQTLAALGFLHRKNVVHRDIAPDNLMLTYDEDDRPQIKVIDLGIAKPLDKTVELTSTGIFLGKLKYSSPEQLGGLAPGETLDGRSDLYSLGVALYELLTGKVPFPGESPRELFAAHLFKEALPFSDTDPDNRVPERLRAVVMKAISKERTRRWATAEEFDREIQELKKGLPAGDDPDATHRLLAKVRDSKDVRLDSVTPSAQDRLDRHFKARGTPTPATRTTSADSSAPRTPTEWDETLAAPVTEKHRRAPVAAFLLGVATVIIVLVLVLRGGRPAPRPPEGPTVPAAAPTPIAAAVLAAPDVATPPPPTAEAAPEATATAPESPSAREDREGLRVAAEAARGETRRARTAAERARAGQLASALYASATRREREAQRHFGDGKLESAAAAFESATALFRQAEIRSRSAERQSPERIAAAEPVPQPTAAPPRPTPVPVPQPTAEPREVRAAPVRPQEPAIRSKSEEEKVRDAVAFYVEAQNSLDVALYARVYPALAGERRRMVENAFASLKSQSLELDIQKVSISGSHAEVIGYERRVATPRVGGEQRDARARRISLEKRGDAWVITGLS